MQETKDSMLQWHPAFFAGIQIELAEDAANLTFESEHQLGTKPMQIDVLIIKKNTQTAVKKNIGRIFRRYNLIEYKNPNDRLSIDDFYKVYGYACFYKADTGKANEIPICEMTLTFVCYHYPQKLVRHLERERQLCVEHPEDGIYYLTGDTLPIQMILVPELSEENNLWLRSLTNNISTSQTAEKLIRAYDAHQQDGLYQSVMDLIVRSNKKMFQEVDVMCEALQEVLSELMKDQLDEREKKGFSDGFSDGFSNGFSDGEQSKLITLIRKKLERGKTISVIADELEETKETILPLYNQVKAELSKN